MVNTTVYFDILMTFQVSLLVLVCFICILLGYAWVCWLCQQICTCACCVMLLWVAQQCYSFCVSSSHLLNLWGLRFSQQCCWGLKSYEPFSCIAGWGGLYVLKDCSSSAASLDYLGLEDGGTRVLCNFRNLIHSFIHLFTFHRSYRCGICHQV